MFRFGRSLEYIQEIIKSPSIGDPVLRVGTVLKSISFTVWMLADHIQWVNKQTAFPSSFSLTSSLFLSSTRPDTARCKTARGLRQSTHVVGSTAWSSASSSTSTSSIKPMKSSRIPRTPRRRLLCKSNLASLFLNSSNLLNGISHTFYISLFSLALCSKKTEQLISLTKNGLDILIPSTRLEILNLNSGLVGLIGTITSLIGLYQAWKGK